MAKHRRKNTDDLELLIEKVNDSRKFSEHLLRDEYQFNDRQIQLLYADADAVIDAAIDRYAGKFAGKDKDDRKRTGVMMLIGYAGYLRHVYATLKCAEDGTDSPVSLPRTAQEDVRGIVDIIYGKGDLQVCGEALPSETVADAAEDPSSFGIHFRKRLYRRPSPLPSQADLGVEITQQGYSPD